MQTNKYIIETIDLNMNIINDYIEQIKNNNNSLQLRELWKLTLDIQKKLVEINNTVL